MDRQEAGIDPARGREIGTQAVQGQIFCGETRMERRLGEAPTRRWRAERARHDDIAPRVGEEASRDVESRRGAGTDVRDLALEVLDGEGDRSSGCGLAI